MRFNHTTSAGGEQEEVYTTLWKPMEDTLEAEMSEFMRHYLMQSGKNVRKGDIYSASKAYFQQQSDNAALRASLNKMKEAAYAYEKFLFPQKMSNANAAAKLTSLKSLDTRVFYPLLLKLTLNHQKEEIDTDNYVQCLGMIESFYVRRSVCNVPTNALNKVCLELCSQYPETEITSWLVERLNHGNGGRRWPSDEEFQDNLLSAKLYQRKKIIKFLLVQLEEAQEHREVTETNNATIEHLMPQTLTAEWQQELGENWEQTYDKWLDTLGNLTLTGYNSELGNLPFTEKKSQLNNTHYEITRWVLQRNVWDDQAIQERALWLRETAVTRWPKANTNLH